MRPKTEDLVRCILKFSSGPADTPFVDVDLFDQGTLATSRPAWHVIEAARRRYLTGLLVLETKPVTNVYLRDGQVYFADRSTDGGLGVRLLVEGVITREQMHRATLMVGGVEHLGRMFDRDSTIDRDAVELCVELMTDDVLTAVADAPVTGYKLHLYKRHPSGVDRWLPTRVEVVTHLVSDPALLADDTDVTPGEAPRSRPHFVPPPATGEVKIPTVEHAPSYTAATQPQRAAAEPVQPLQPVDHIESVEHITEVAEATPEASAPASPEPQPEPVAETPAADEPERFSPMRLMALSEAVTDVVPVITADTPASGANDRDDTAGIRSFATVPPAAFTTLQVPAVNGSVNGNGNGSVNGYGNMNGHSASESPAVQTVVEVLPGSIADEVAEAVRRALAAIDNP
jgi:hypothetical protein